MVSFTPTRIGYILIQLPQPRPIASVSTSASATIVNASTRVTISQTFRLPSSFKTQDNVEVNAAVCAFDCDIDGRRVKGSVKEKEEAREEYTKAVNEGRVAAVLEQQQEDGILGNMDVTPTSSITTHISYIQELSHDAESDELRFTLLSKSVHPQPPSMTLSIEMATPVISIRSPSHSSVSVMVGRGEVETDEFDPRKALVTLESEGMNWDKEVVVVVKVKDMDKPVCMMERHPVDGTHAIGLTMVPRFALNEIRTELVILVDRSGSMSGSKIHQASQALHLFLKSIPAGSYFNIIGFGSTHQLLFPRSVEYTASTLATAEKHVANLQADLGGTEIEAALDGVFKSRRTDMPTNVVVMTDGEVWNVESLLESVKMETVKWEKGDTRRCCRLWLITRLTGRVDGRFEMVEEVKEEKKTMSFFSKEKVPVKPPAPKVPKYARMVQQAPFVVPKLWPGARFNCYAILDPSIPLPTHITLTGKSTDGPLSLTLPLLPSTPGTTLHTLAARNLIRDLTDSTSHLTPHFTGPVPLSVLKSETVHLGVKYGLASKFTSFIVVDREGGVKEQRETDTEKQVESKRGVFMIPPLRPTPKPASFMRMRSSLSFNSAPQVQAMSFGGSPGAPSYSAPPAPMQAMPSYSAAMMSAPTMSAPPSRGGGGMMKKVSRKRSSVVEEKVEKESVAPMKKSGFLGGMFSMMKSKKEKDEDLMEYAGECSYDSVECVDDVGDEKKDVLGNVQTKDELLQSLAGCQNFDGSFDAAVATLAGVEDAVAAWVGLFGSVSVYCAIGVVVMRKLLVGLEEEWEMMEVKAVKCGVKEVGEERWKDLVEMVEKVVVKK
ncbi:von Willebrand factor type A domain-containing protein [Chytridium lagenaria]|nr:von Willebrand factor type A domain-containing protein [Chytridium lagenaria]